MSRWFRVYADMVDDPKVQRLPPDLFKALINLWCLTAGNDGLLPSAEDIGFKLRMKPEKVKQIISALHDADLIETTETGLRPHNWDARQFKTDVTDPTNAVRQKRYRDRHKVTPTVTVNAVTDKLPDTESDTEEERKKDARPSAAPSFAPMTDETEVYRRGKEILGASSGGMIKNLIKAQSGSIPKARAAIEIASTKHDPREYIGAIIKGKDPPNADARERGDAW